MNRLARVASGIAWYLALLCLIPGIGRYWTFLAFARTSAALDQPLLVIAYGIAGACILLAFLWRARQRRLIFGAFVVSLIACSVYAGVPALENSLTFITCTLIAGVVVEFVRQNLPLFRSLAASNIRLAPILLKTLLLWSPALVFVGLGLLLNHIIVEEVTESLYESALIDEYCELESDVRKALVPCTALDGRLPASALTELPLHESIALHVESLFLLRMKSILQDLSGRPPHVWANRDAVMKEVTALKEAVQPTAVLGLEMTVPIRSYANDARMRTLNERLRVVEAQMAALGRSGRLRGLLVLLNPVHARLSAERDRLRKAIAHREKILRAQERDKDPAAFDIRSLRAEAHIELTWVNTAPAFRTLRSDLNRRFDKKATPAEIAAAIRVGILRIMPALEAETRKRLDNALQKGGALVYDAGIVPRLCRLAVARDPKDEKIVIDCPGTPGENGWSVTPLSLRDSIDLSIARWHERGEKELENGLIDSGLMSARTAGQIKTAYDKVWTRDRPLPRRIGLGVRDCGLLNIGCHLSNHARRSAERTYSDARRDLRRTSVQAVNKRADAGAASTIEQIDLARSELYGGLTETRRAVDASIDQIARAGAVASALLQLWLALAIIKSFLYVLATEVFHVKGPSEIGFESGSMAEGRYDVAATIEIPTRFDVPLNTSVVGVNQGKRTVVPQPFSAMLARIVQWKWALHRGTRVGNAPIRYTQPGGQTGVLWNMKEGEEIVFRYRDLLGFSDNVKLGTTISLQLSTLLFGRYIYHTARSVGGPGLLLLSVKGQVEETQDAVEAFPLERLIAWNKHTKFRVADDRTLGAVFKDGFIVQTVRRHGTPSGLVLVGAPLTRTALVQGTVRFVKVFVVPF